MLAPSATPSLRALDAEADLRGAQAAAAAFAELLEYRRLGGASAPMLSDRPLARVAALSRELAGAVDTALQPTGFAPAARQRIDIAAERVRVSAATAQATTRAPDGR